MLNAFLLCAPELFTDADVWSSSPEFQNEPDRLVWNYVLLTPLGFNDNFT